MGFSDILIIIVFSWPAILSSLGMCVTGLLTRKAWLVFLSAGLITPFTLFLSGLPPVRGLSFLLPLFLVAAGLTIRKKTWLAWLLGGPVMLLEVWVVMNIISNMIHAPTL
jgi:hypothetical protein